jgi:succinate dehydrogenase flavin-adding protein (antitoxin of CptAB toxin-antitoxin module)
MRELDVLLTRYVDSLASLQNSELTRLEQFLELQDPQLQRYLLAGEDPSNPDFLALVARIRSPARV